MIEATEYRAAVAALEAAQRQLGATPRSDPAAREAARLAADEAGARVRDLKDRAKDAARLRNFAGCDSPLGQVLRERHPELAPPLEEEALRRQTAREEQAAARRAEKAAASPAPAPAPPARPGPEIVRLVAGQTGRRA